MADPSTELENLYKAFEGRYFGSARLEMEALMEVLFARATQGAKKAWQARPGDKEELDEYLFNQLVELSQGPLCQSADNVGARYVSVHRAEEGAGTSLALVIPQREGKQLLGAHARTVMEVLASKGQYEAEKRFAGICADLVLNRVRNTVKLSAKAAGNKWARVPEAGACPFCLMLASRGAVYTDKTTATRSQGGSRYHAHCKCSAVEILHEADVPPAARRAWDLTEKFNLRTVKDWAAARKDPAIIEYLLDNGIRDDPTRTGRLGPSLLPADFKVTGITPDARGLHPTLEDFDVNCLGKVRMRKIGPKYLAGHLFGTGAPYKTEFPSSWTVDDIIYATEWVKANPLAIRHRGDRTDVLGELYGVIVEVSYYENDGRLFYRHTVPINGRGVYYNDGDGNKIPRLFDVSVIGGGKTE
ncbi:MAG: hypothetical protein E6700_09790 [Winkia neuii]|uniref:Bacterial EndoU nuclease domain-containing protein n=1 Tax=Winkia neuii TaxID=33007 RepID=A0A2I1IMM5_9ACTO|nr:hypothetical protein [Winkia neuii]OFJ68648.1 hypothetical protein HMPREF2851_01835 [Actinomyces sp. HMSC064C12]OFK00132.1 hypothetical protein HMPREF2835_03435 [Actinomyces sp. HMSC072A03]OFT56726.1 hypothetical protein HMPREF3152_00530 [Actinomyces sp. HMSC06A08]KWZ75183.1 hypothetical protein HMPREF3198_00263 [Winkia neuii]MDK8099795.1 hypothetical protein [Winkia neuii]